MFALLLLAVAGPEPTDLVRSDQDHHWRPGPAVVKLLESKLHVPERMGGPLNNFDRYYTGLYRDGHRIVFVEMVNLTERPPGSGAVHVTDPANVPAIADGGCGIVRFSYDPVLKASSDLVCNGGVPLPPPPPPPPG